MSQFKNILFIIISVISISLVPKSFAGTDGASMIEIPDGDFQAGTKKTVTHVNKFSIDKYEVTNTQYKAFKNDFSVPAGKENHPVAEVSYFDAEAYCKSVGKRLPTRDEWEKAARGTDGRAYPWGNKFEAGRANTLEDEKNSTTPVGSYEKGKSPYGVMDMSGNVWEWVDAWDGDQKKYRISLGGSYFDDAENAKVTATLKSIPDDNHEYVGFRCAK